MNNATQTAEFPSVADLSLQERSERIAVLRTKMVEKDITDEELRYALELLRADRKTASTRAKEKAPTRTTKPLSLEEL